MSEDVSYPRSDIPADVAVLSGDQIETASADMASRAVVVPLFGVTIFLSAALLFAVQPMFTKLVLPRLGGSQSVWSIAMVFFQGVLLLGYAYADALTRLLGKRTAVLVHLAVMGGGMLFLPLAIAKTWGQPSPEHEQTFLLGLFAVSIGFPFFALSANAPLLQAWYTRCRPRGAQTPYVLYAASNAGSLLALFAYPFVAELLLPLHVQNAVWSYGYTLLIALIAACGALVFVQSDEIGARVDAATPTAPPPAMSLMGSWVMLAFVPSALLIAVTTHITTDIAAAPFLWVLPLSAYLLSFVVVFGDSALARSKFWLIAQPWLLAFVAATLALDIRTWLTVDVLVHLLLFFITAMICHGRMAATRPDQAYLTRFYLCMSLGGVLGGIFAGLLAPRIFSWIAEYPIVLVLSVLARPGVTMSSRQGRLVLAGFAAIVAIAVAPGLLRTVTVTSSYNWIVWAVALVLTGLAIVARRAPLWLAALLSAVFLLTRAYPPNVRQLETVRSFFGVHKIEVTADGRFRVLRHGMELHGAQRLLDDAGRPVIGRPQPTTYFHPDSPIATVFDAVHSRLGKPIDAAVIGLGAGSAACLVNPDDHLDYYEIDSDVIRIARDPGRFTFLRDCKPDARIVLGDARLMLQAASDARYDLIMVDAFSSDSIPVHLLTREALGIYLSRLKPGGIIMTHISNNHLDLTDVVAATAASAGLVARLWDEDEVPGLDPMIKFSTVMVLARSADDFGELADWDVQKAVPTQRPWTDDFSNLLQPLLKRLEEDDD